MFKMEQISSVSDWSAQPFYESPHSSQFGTQLDEGSSPTAFTDSEYADRYLFGSNQVDDLMLYRYIRFDESHTAVRWQSSGDISLFVVRLVDAQSADLNDALSDLREARGRRHLKKVFHCRLLLRSRMLLACCDRCIASCRVLEIFRRRTEKLQLMLPAVMVGL